MHIDIYSIKTRTMLVLGSVLILALIVGMVFIRPIIERHFIGMARTQMSENSVYLAKDIERLLEHASAELQAIASLPEVSSFDPEAMDQILMERSKSNFYFSHICITDKYGRIVSSPMLPTAPDRSVPERRMAYVRAALDGSGPVFMDLLPTDYGSIAAGIALPIEDRSGASRGVIMGFIVASDENFMNDRLRNIDIDSEEISYITGTDGRLLAHSSIKLSPAKYADYDYSAAKPVQSALEGHPGFMEHAFGGKRYYAAYYPLKLSGGAVVVQSEASAIEAHADRALSIIAFGAVTAFILIALIQGLVINIALKPLSLLAESFRKKAPLPASLLSGRRGEVAELSREISALIEDLRRRDEMLEEINRELEARVEKRTSELTEINGRLMAEVAERKLTEERLWYARRRFEDVASNTGDWIWEIDEKGMFVFSSSGIERLMGIRAEEMIGRNFYETFMPNASEEMQRAVLSEFQVMRPFKDVVRTVTGRDGRTRLIETSGVPIFDPSGEFRGYRGSARNVTERVLMDTKIKDSLREKEVLLKEIHHRVKNNMQVISSLLNLQTRYVTDSDTISLFKESQNRLKAMALVHEKLYQNENLSQVNLSDYINNLAAHLQSSMGGGRVAMELRLSPDMQLDIDTIIPCGLILNELVSNCIKHAFRDRAYGKVTVSVNEAEGRFVLQVCDDGPGLPEGFDMESGSSLGTKLISALVAQIGGSIKAESTPQGACFTVSFPAPAASRGGSGATRVSSNKENP